MKNIVSVILAILIYGHIGNTIVAQQLIAHYPLSYNPNDSTGQNPPMTLINTPFQDGGIYCNGIYAGSGNPNYCHAITPNLANLDMNAFSISAYFKVTESLTEIHPVFVGGQSYRWIAFYLTPDNTVLLKYNNSNYVTSSVHYVFNQWHKAAINYKDSTAQLYLDDTLAISIDFDLIHGNDKDVGITDLASGRVFKGILRDLKIINLDSVSTNIEENVNISPDLFFLAQNYPNPFNPVTTIQYSIPKRSNVTLKVYDVLGKEVAVLVNEEKDRGVYLINFDAAGLASGMYLYRLQAGNPSTSSGQGFVETKKMILIR